ncbi:MAG: 3-isopropylmalate dehydratase large subunit [Burkholderiales bacterium]
MPSTMSQKILARAAGRKSVAVGDIVTARCDLAMTNDITAPFSLKQFHAAGATRVFDPDRICVIAGRHMPFRDEHLAMEVQRIKQFCEQHAIKTVYTNCEGMDHALAPELGLIRPGMLILNGDSHACTYGAFGAFSVGMGSTDMAYVLAFGETWLRVPATIAIRFHGKPRAFVSSKDYILAALGKLGVDGARYKALEYSGTALSALSMEERMTVTNMSIEMGGKAGMIEPDAITEAWVQDKTRVPYDIVRSDPDAEFDRVIDIDVDALTPLVAKPYNPGNVAPVSEVRGTKVTQVTIGTCTNGRLVDLEQAASILRGRKVAPGVRLYITPATKFVYEKAMKSGLLEQFWEAGAVINPAGCGPCDGLVGALASEDVCVATHNRNFRGRMGHREAKIYLASPYVAAATAVAGAIIDPLEVMQ